VGGRRCVEILLKAGADVNAVVGAHAYGSPLRDSVVVGGRRCVEILLKAGADVNAVVGAHAYGSPLHEACNIPDPDTANHLSKLLLEHGAEVSRSNKYGQTPLVFAASQGHLDICKNLLERMGPDIEGRGGQLDRALYFAARNGHEEIVDFLITAGAPLVPPDDVPSKRLTRKWKYMRFESKVEAAARERILSKLAFAPSRSVFS
jgi:ankyrin repeat protein